MAADIEENSAIAAFGVATDDVDRLAMPLIKRPEGILYPGTSIISPSGFCWNSVIRPQIFALSRTPSITIMSFMAVRQAPPRLVRS
jgi:hypothetical protein